MRYDPVLVLDDPVAAFEFVRARIEQPLDVSGYQAIGVTRRGKLIAGFVFHDMQPNRADVTLSVAGRGAFLSRKVLEFLYWNTFKNLCCTHLTCRTAEDNVHAIVTLQRAGFMVEGRQRMAWDGKRDAILLGLTENDLIPIEEV